MNKDFLVQALEAAKAAGIVQSSELTEVKEHDPAQPIGGLISATEDYNELEGIRSSQLKDMTKTLKTYSYIWLEGGKEEEQQKSKKAYDMGTLLHTAVLEPEKLDTQIGLKLDARKKENKLANKELEKAGKILVPFEDYQTVFKLSEFIKKEERIQEFLKGGIYEAALQFQYRGLLFKIKMDILQKGKFLADLKFFANASPSKFSYLGTAQGLDIQAALYVMGAAAHGLIPDKNFYYVVIEKHPPYDYTIIEVSEQIIKEGKRKIDMLIDQYEEYVLNSSFPSYNMGKNYTW